jgi:hypothetical protein
MALDDLSKVKVICADHVCLSVLLSARNSTWDTFSNFIGRFPSSTTSISNKINLNWTLSMSFWMCVMWLLSTFTNRSSWAEQTVLRPAGYFCTLRHELRSFQSQYFREDKCRAVRNSLTRLNMIGTLERLKALATYGQICYPSLFVRAACAKISEAAATPFGICPVACSNAWAHKIRRCFAGHQDHLK